MRVERGSLFKNTLPEQLKGKQGESTRQLIGERVKDDQKAGEIKSAGKDEVASALNKINDTVRIFNRSFQFSKHEESGRMLVRVVDTETKKVIREIPPEEILDIVGRLDEMLGLLVDERR